MFRRTGWTPMSGRSGRRAASATTRPALPNWPPSAGRMASSWWSWRPPAATSGWPSCCCGSSASPARAAQCPQRAPFRRGDGLPGEDRHGSTPASSPTTPRSGGPADAAAEPAQQRLKALVSRLSQVTGDLIVNKQRRAAATDAETSTASTRSSCCSSASSATSSGEIASLIDDDPLWARLDRPCARSRAWPAAPSPC